jgi:N,N'-diacetylchitobiose transport system permease protein
LHADAEEALMAPGLIATGVLAIMAGSTLMTIPVIVLFLFVQGRMTTGLVSGAVKG